MAQAQKFRLVFMGTPDFAATVLTHVCGWSGGDVVAVYTQPDRPAGRGHKLRPSAVKEAALERHLPVYQPLNFRDQADRDALAALRPDFLIVAAYGLILPQAVLDLARMAPLNVHGSLLPRYRGAAPIQRAIMENWQEDAVSGVSIMRMAAALDAGPVYATAPLPLAGHTAGSLHDALAELGGQVLLRVLDELAAGTAHAVEQDPAQVTYAAKMSKNDGVILWDRPVAQVHAQIRGVTPWPAAQAVFSFDGEADAHTVLLLPGRCETEPHEFAPGTLFRDAQGLRVACADGWYCLERLKPQGRKEMHVRDCLNGHWRALPLGVCGHALLRPQA